MALALPHPQRRPGRVARTFRLVIGFVYLFGAPTHVYFAVFDPDGYRGMSEWAPPITSVSRTFWDSWFVPNARVLALLLAAAELTIAILILSRDSWTRLGLAAAALFHVALAAIFGMWAYTLPMIVALAYVANFEFPDGPIARLVERVRGVEHR